MSAQAPSFVPLIDTTYIFKYTTIDPNTDSNLLVPNIIYAQDTHIMNILGEQLYNAIMQKVVDGVISATSSSSNPYKILLNNYIQPALSHFTVYESLADIQYRMTNKSILNKNGENATNTGLSELYHLEKRALARANRYNSMIREQIVNNPNDYPEYYTQIGVERIVPRRSTYFSGVAYGFKKNQPYNGGVCCGGPTGFDINPF